jgi:hypothetical protein
MKIIETLTTSWTTSNNARNILVKHGAQFVAEAIKDNPSGPITMVTTRDATEVTYEVLIGDTYSGDRGESRTIWSRTVKFGATDRTVAGGYDFVTAARAQDEVASAAYVLISNQE